MEKSCNGLDIYKAQLTKIKNASQRSTNTSWKPNGSPLRTVYPAHLHNKINLLTYQQIMLCFPPNTLPQLLPSFYTNLFQNIRYTYLQFTI